MKFRRDLIKLKSFSILFFLTFAAFGQNAHYFKPWKSKVHFEKREIIFLIDTTKTDDDTKVLLIVASKIDDHLKIKGIDTTPLPFPNETIADKDILILKLEPLEKAYVKLNTFENKIPLCYRLKISQLNPISKKMIETEISFSIAEKQKGVDDLGEELAERLIKHFE